MIKNIEKINKNLQILQNVADKLIGGQLHPGNVAHDAPTKGYTISNCIKNLKEAFKDNISEEELKTEARSEMPDYCYMENNKLAAEAFMEGALWGYKRKHG